MNDVWERYLDYAENYNTHLSGSYRYNNTFGICLRKTLAKLNSSYEFINKMNDGGTIMFLVTYLNEGISSVIEQNERDREESIIKVCPENNNDFLSMVHVLLRLRGELEQMPGHKGLSITEDEAVGCIPECLYLFLSLSFGGSDVLEI